MKQTFYIQLAGVAHQIHGVAESQTQLSDWTELYHQNTVSSQGAQKGRKLSPSEDS